MIAPLDLPARSRSGFASAEAGWRAPSARSWLVPHGNQADDRASAARGDRRRLTHLATVQVGVAAALAQQLGVGAVLDDAALVHGDDAMGDAHGREPMGDDDHG